MRTKQRALTVIHGAQAVEVQRGIALKQALAIVQGACIDRGSAREQLAVAVIQRTVDLQRCAFGGTDRTTQVTQAAGMQFQRLGRHQALGVVQRAGDAQGQGLFTEDLGVAVVQCLGNQGKRTTAGDFTSLVGDAVEIA